MNFIKHPLFCLFFFHLHKCFRSVLVMWDDTENGLFVLRHKPIKKTFLHRRGQNKQKKIIPPAQHKKRRSNTSVGVYSCARLWRASLPRISRSSSAWTGTRHLRSIVYSCPASCDAGAGCMGEEVRDDTHRCNRYEKVARNDVGNVAQDLERTTGMKNRLIWGNWIWKNDLGVLL